MSKYDWLELEKEFITGKDCSLKKFAERLGINYNTANFQKHTKGWLKKRAKFRQEKSNKAIGKIQEQQVSEEVALNRRHIDVFTKHLELIEKALTSEEGFYAIAGAKKMRVNESDIYVGGDNMHTVLKSTAKILKVVQEGQRLALGMDKEISKGNESSIEGAIIKSWEGNNGNA